MVPAAGLGPQSRNRVSAWLPHPPQFCEWGLPLPKIAQKLVAPVEWGDRIKPGLARGIPMNVGLFQSMTL